MITEHDLKIGNLVKVYRFSEDAQMTVFSVKSIYLDETNEPCYFVELNDGFCLNLNALKGVELTDELLYLYGFVKYPNPNNHPSFIFKAANNHFKLLKSVFPVTKWSIYEPSNYPDSKLQYFHEVQNWFYQSQKQVLSLI